LVPGTYQWVTYRCGARPTGEAHVGADRFQSGGDGGNGPGGGWPGLGAGRTGLADQPLRRKPGTERLLADPTRQLPGPGDARWLTVSGHRLARRPTVAQVCPGLIAHPGPPPRTAPRPARRCPEPSARC